MKIFAANWKLHKNPNETREFFSNWNRQALELSSREVIFFPQTVSLEAAATALAHSKISWGAQNSYFEAKGAFTGEISAQAVKDMGGKYILLGHSERRTLFHETDELIAKKLKLVQSLDLIPMLCIGETLAEREAGKTKSILEKQLKGSLALVDKKKHLMVAYEPVWAIGTGKVASIAQVKEAHEDVRNILNELGFSNKTPILYGGSVKPDNAKELISIPSVDGFLVGGASLEVESFLTICGV